MGRGLVACGSLERSKPGRPLARPDMDERVGMLARIWAGTRAPADLLPRILRKGRQPQRKLTSRSIRITHQPETFQTGATASAPSVSEGSAR